MLCAEIRSSTRLYLTSENLGPGSVLARSRVNMLNGGMLSSSPVLAHSLVLATPLPWGRGWSYG